MSTFSKIYHFGYFSEVYIFPQKSNEFALPQGWLAILFLLAVGAYLIGSINFAMVLSRARYHQDIRDYGSKNAGTTNMMRTYGKKAAALTLLGDILKGVFCCAVGIFFVGVWGGYVAGTACVVGHIFPIWFQFRGGKGVATTAAVVLCLSPLTFLLLFGIFVLLVLTTRYISLGSVVAMLFYPLTLYRFFTTGIETSVIVFPSRVWFSFFIAILIIYKHKDNIRRLWEGKENKFSLNHKK